ncbi:uncharacterized protein A1O9_12028 [Exophiala aquamarina CBS 119918]|uniref:Major facilitator superfamily (MFS) profile domain-containing protein n=1 Tax=Exophiala aquamarina CBS 119918 TaxID=1182545 RepID=A0A072NYC7_9EURO|nr:uncharacterized protein A1O9_12028 [Exophiala aquamarina CBS 119918]KEF52038.1 hypothetical protein A1O9_12028 [Exophiala aquamarina CBS 119918]
MSRPPEQSVSDKAMEPTSTNSLSSEEQHGGLPGNQLLKHARSKVDRRLLIWYAFVYLIMRIHVSNITNTAIINLEEGTGIKKQLGNLTSSQWAWALSIFYYPYMFFEPVATLALKRFSPSLWMSRIMITWVWALRDYTLGLVDADIVDRVLSQCVKVLPRIMQAFWHAGSSWEQLRLVSTLAFCKILSSSRSTQRLGEHAFFYACGMFSGTVSGLLAYAISFMNGAGGLAGWRWVFILEGLPVLFCAVYTFFFLPNYPETVKFLSKEEKGAILASLPAEAPTMNAKTWDFSQVKSLFKDPTFVPFLMIWITHGIGGWGISFVLPTVIYELGISGTANSQLMTMPPYTMVFIILCGLAYFIHTKRLSPWVAGLGVEILQIICYILLITVKHKVAKYIFVMIATAASQSFFAIIWPERIRAARGTTTAGLAIGVTNWSVYAGDSNHRGCLKNQATNNAKRALKFINRNSVRHIG